MGGIVVDCGLYCRFTRSSHPVEVTSLMQSES
jgi:hypothetical protein